MLHFCKREVIVKNTIGTKFLIHLSTSVVIYHNPKPYLQTLNTHVGAGPILVEPYYETSTECFFLVKQKLGDRECCFTLGSYVLPSNWRPELGTYNEQAMFLIQL